VLDQKQTVLAVGEKPFMAITNPSWPSPPVNHPSDPVPILFPEMPVKEDSEVRLRVRQKNFKQVN
jgi:hypothetical protein